MFCEVELVRDVTILAENLDKNGRVLQRSIIMRLLKDLLSEKATKDHGYFLAVTRLKSIGKGEVVEESGNAIFPVVFKCRTFIPFRGEILLGVVHHIYSRGVCLRCGPIQYVYLSARKMPDYHYVPGRNPVFLSDGLSKIENGAAIRFMVLGVRWVEESDETKRDFQMLASLEGDFLGPISLP